GAARGLQPLSLLQQCESGRGQQPADEAAARLVVAAVEDEDRQDQDQRHQDPRRCRQDDRVHREILRPARSAATAATPANTITAISPIVSKPRKSTRMTLTILWPKASGTLLSSKKRVR